MTQEGETKRPLYRPNRRKVLKTSAGTLTALSAAPVAAADNHTDDRPTAVDDLFTALNCFERVAGTAELALVVDFRREGIERLREETDNDDALSFLNEAETHNEMAATAVLRGRSDQVQEHLDQTSTALDQMDTDGATELINAQETPFETIFGDDLEFEEGLPSLILEGLESFAEDSGINPTPAKMALRTFTSNDEVSFIMDLTNISHIDNPITSRQMVFQTEIYLERMRAAIEQLTANNYSLSFDGLSTLVVSNGDQSYNTSLGLSLWLWATGYSLIRSSINVISLSEVLEEVFEVVGEVRRILSPTHQAMQILSDNISIDLELFPEQSESFEITGRLDGLVPVGLLITHLLKAEISNVDEFTSQIAINDESPAEDFESLLRDFAALSEFIVPVRAFVLRDGEDINLLTTPLPEIGEEINEFVYQQTGVDIEEEIDNVRNFAKSLFARVLNLEIVGNLLPEEVIIYLLDQLEDS